MDIFGVIGDIVPVLDILSRSLLEVNLTVGLEVLDKVTVSESLLYNLDIRLDINVAGRIFVVES